MLSRFFINRPIFASVISILIVLVGAMSIFVLPIAQYPDIVPPVVQVTASYPGADPNVIAETVAAPIEQQVNGVDNMLYMSSQSAADGSYTLNVTFALGTNIDMNTVLTQNRVSAAMAQLPEQVQRQGVTTKKVSSSLVMILTLFSPDGKYDDLFVTNYVTIYIKDVLSRVPGVGNINLYPSKDYSMRVWLDPDKLESRNLTVDSVVNAIKNQNVQVAAGQLGQPPVPKGQMLQLSVNTLGRLADVKQFEDIIVKTGEGTRVTRVRDVAQVELGGKAYDFLSFYQGKPAATMMIYQSPGSNAMDVTNQLHAAIEQLRKDFPQGLKDQIVYEVADFVRASVKEVVITLLEAFALVVLVVFIFLQNWRATIIPVITIPVSIIGTFAVMSLFGFSINMITLFGLVLAIGLVVDDAIVVVENVERNMTEFGLSSKDAAIRAMNEITGAIVGITCVLMAVFLPPAFLGGITGELFRQFSLTIAVTVLLSAVNALTLSPALCSIMLRPRENQKKWLFEKFNSFFGLVTDSYAKIVSISVRKVAIATVIFIGLVGLSGVSLMKVPLGFLPLEDDGLILVNIQMPDGASLERTTDVVHRVAGIVEKTQGIKSWCALVGFSVIDAARSNLATMLIPLKPWEERDKHGLGRESIIKDLSAEFAKIQDGVVFPFTFPPIIGLGTGGGFELQLLDKASLGFEALDHAGSQLAQAANTQPDLQSVHATFRASYPNIFLDIDRTQAMTLKIPLQSVFETLQTYLGSTYVNDFNKFSRTWQVRVQAESFFRRSPEDVARLYVKNLGGSMIPLGTVLSARFDVGPMRVDRYNMFPTAKIMGEAAPGYSSSQGLDAMQDLAKEILPPGMGYDWTNMAYQEIKAAGKGTATFVMAILVVILILAALYESWIDPIAVVLTVPLAVLGAAIGLIIRGMDNNIYTQVGLVLLVALAAKNAILIVEFVRDERAKGMELLEAAVEGAKIRFRPIIMTSFAFILGVYPLVVASGAGAVSRRSVGTAVFSGMLGVTLLGVFFIPVLYVLMQGRKRSQSVSSKPENSSTDIPQS
ncbi:MAG: multidrug efflux RND transporter permease subunit [Desulfomonile sp.]